MKHPSRSAFALATSVAALLGGAVPVAACQVCFGDPNSPITQSVEMGVWFLLGVILLVQAAFGIFFFVYLRRRARSVRDPLPRPVLRLVKKEV
ncbi:MAG: hypothetical protein AB7N53_01985 [Candidatus Binatia bacterium]